MLAELAVRMPAAFAALVNDGDDRLLEGLVKDVAATRQGIAEWPLLRPYTQKKRLATECIDSLHAAITEYLAACAASSMAVAQRHAGKMQAALDRGAAANGELAAAEGDPLPDPDSSSMEAFLADCLAMSSRSSGISLREALLGEANLDRLFDLRPASNLGVAFLLAAAGSQCGVDALGFRTTLRAAHAYFTQRSAGLRSVAEDPDFVRALREADVVSANCTWLSRASMERSQSDQQFVDVITGLVADMVEGPGALIARVVLRLEGIKHQPFAKLSQDNATTHIDRVADVPACAFLLEGFDTTLRVARAHNQVWLRDERVVATRGGRDHHYSKLELVDRMLHCVETCGAVMLALRQSLGELGVDVGVADLTAIGLDGLALARLGLSSLYGVEAQLTVEGEVLHARLVGDADLSPFSAATLLRPVVGHAKAFVLSLTSRGETVELQGPTSLIRDPFPADQAEMLIHFADLARSCLLDGARAMSEPELRATLASAASQIAATQSITLNDGQKLRRAIRIASSVDDSDLERTLRACMRRMSDEPIPAWALDDLRAWGRHVPQLRMLRSVGMDAS